MYAIVDIAGQQLKVEKDQKVFVNRLQGKEGSKVDFDQILLIDDNGKVKVGTPIVKDMVVSATIVAHLKADKVKVFKKKRRKGYKKLNGHRQLLTELQINGIAAGKAKPKATAKPEAKPAESKKAAPKAKAPQAKKEVKPKATTAAKPAAEKKESKAATASKAKSTTAKKEVKAAAKPKAAATKKPQAAKAKKPADKKKES
jgi:large subunit ribosomal protein L21